VIRIERLERADRVVNATVVVPQASSWFAGHFPGEPILPAIAHLAIVVRVMEASHGGRWSVAAISVLRLRHPVRPDEPIELKLSVPDVAGASQFELCCHGTIASRGAATLRHEA
jgi:3-hydroxymyristoyl/3-hydroxydecanoyl-(acyl carrier protein) dehydratase